MGVELHGDADLNFPVGARREIRATITIPLILPPSTVTTTAAPAPACKLDPTSEVFDSLSGRTHAVPGQAMTLN